MSTPNRFHNFTATCVLLVIVLLMSHPASGQNSRYELEAQTLATVSSNDINPLWLYANQWGLYNQFDQSGALARVKGVYHLSPVKHLSLSAGVSALAQSSGDTWLHEAFVSGSFHFLDFSVGKQAIAPNAINDSLTSGMFLGSANAMPIPRFWVGIFDYTPLPFTNGWVEVRGALSNGWLNDTHTPNGHKEVSVHEKYIYLKMGKTKIQPYIGLYHSALYGGVGIPADFWATFLGKGSDKIGGGEATNAAGAHMGLWHGGVYVPVGDWKGHLYLQKPFADGSGMYVNWGRNKDFTLGIHMQRQTKQWVTGISLEAIRTDWQSGPGTPDPYDPVAKEGIWPGSFNSVQDFVAQRIPEMTDAAANWTEGDLYSYLRDRWNEGNFFGGRDDYMNNGMYYPGWTWQGLSMGTPLMSTADMAARFAPDWETHHTIYFINTRLRALHLGIEGWMAPSISYRMKLTGTRNYGSYEESYVHRYSWEIDQDDYFATPKNQFYNSFEINWFPPCHQAWQLSATVAADYGDMYQSTGGKLSLIWKLK